MATTFNTLAPHSNGTGLHGYSENAVLGGAPARALSTRPSAGLDGIAGSIADYASRPRDLLERFQGAFEVRDDYDAWLLDQLRDATARLDSCQKRERRARDEARQRAVEAWDQDQQMAVFVLTEKLHRYPQRIARQLEETLQGAAWKVERWKVLGQCLKSHGTWNEVEQARAWNLLGVPLGEDGPDSTAGAQPSVVLSVRKIMVEGEIARLVKLQRDVLIARDERARNDAVGGVPQVAPAAIKAIQREAKQAWTQIQWVVARLEQARSAPASGVVKATVTDPNEGPRDEPVIVSAPAKTAKAPAVAATTTTTRVPASTPAVSNGIVPARRLEDLSACECDTTWGRAFAASDAPYRPPALVGSNGLPLVPTGMANPIVSFG